MPYRRLPNTDAARVRALQTALQKSITNPQVISAELQTKAKFFLPSLQSGIRMSRTTYSQSVEKGANFSLQFKRTKMYISHFIQVLNMSIARGEFKPEARNFYGLVGKKLPSLETPEEILEWGQKIIEGDHQRIRMGGLPIYNPRITAVEYEFKRFSEAAHTNDFRLKNDTRTAEYINDLRQRGDAIILDIWNEVEAHFANEPNAEKRRQACSEFGVAYVFRKSERAEINTESESNNDSNM